MNQKEILFYNIIEKLYFFLIFLLLVRSTSKDFYGALITIFTLASIVISIIKAGIPELTQREIARRGKNSFYLYKKFFTVTVILIIPYTIVNFILYKALYGTYLNIVFYSAIIIAFTNFLIEFSSSVLLGLEEIKVLFTTSLFIRLISFIAAIYFCNNFYLITTIIITSNILVFIFLSMVISKKLLKDTINEKEKFDFGEAISLIKNYLPLVLAGIFVLIYDKIDVILISKYIDAAGSAEYNIGYGIYKASTIAFSFLLISGYSKVSLLSKRNQKTIIRKFIIKYSRGILMISVPLTIILYLFSDIIINTFYTTRYQNSILVLKILSFSIIGLSLNNLMGVVLNGVGMFRENLIIVFASASINVILITLFIEKYGIVGCAVITLITEYSVLIMDYITFKIKKVV